VFLKKLSRTCSSIGLLFQICEWQFRQSCVWGMLAAGDRSTVLWQ
jgi:hypothetical protein